MNIKRTKAFFIRLLLSIMLAFILSIFSGEKNITMIGGYTLLLFGLSYFIDYIRRRNSE